MGVPADLQVVAVGRRRVITAERRRVNFVGHPLTLVVLVDRQVAPLEVNKHAAVLGNVLNPVHIADVQHGVDGPLLALLDAFAGHLNALGLMAKFNVNRKGFFALFFSHGVFD